MHLKRLEIQGFKSFAEFTAVEFDEGMTAVVGPNGSGKSNITDAIRWVLGEQSVRTLRGGKMEDVIFNGTQSRRAMNYAEVTMVLDNEDGILPIEFQEVQVTRRLYRSGESEYLLNKTNCRLKDIVTLFMDTGLGKDGYSIIGQGRVDDVLSNKSEDRRKILEEAAGIVKYKVRKEESQRKLSSAEQNLIRINDILAELFEQLSPLEEQAQKARKYHQLSEEWTKLDMGLSLHLVGKHSSFLSSVDADLSVLSEGITELEDEILSLRQENQEALKLQESLREKEDATRREMNLLQEFINEKQRQMAVSSDRREQLLSRIESEKNQDGSMQSEMQQIDTEISVQRKKRETLERQRTIFSEQLEKNEKEMAGLLSVIGEKEKKSAQMRERMDVLRELIFSSREELSVLAAEIGSVDVREKSISQERLLVIGESDALLIRKEDTEKLFSDFSEKEKKERDVFEEKTTLINQSKEKLENLLFGKAETQRELDQTKYRLRTLEELERAKEGFQEPVKRLLQEAQNDEKALACIKGVVGELIQVLPENETAIEIALGQSIHHIVTFTDADASYLIRLLKEKQIGRATFLPMNIISSRSIEVDYLAKAKKEKGFVGIAAELISYPSELKAIIENLLGRIIISEDMNSARLIAKVTNQHIRIVTLEGDVINPGGSMTGGSLKRQSMGILSRARLIEELREKSVVLQKNMDKNSVDQEKTQVELHSYEKEQEESDSRLRAVSLERVRVEEILSQILVDQNRLKERLLRVDEQKKIMEEEALSHQSQKEEISSSITVQETEMEELKQSIETATEDNKKVQEELDDIRSEIGDMRISVGSIEESIKGALEMEERIIREKENFSDNLEKRKKQREDAGLEIVTLQEKEAVLHSEVEELKKKEEHFLSSLSEIKKENDDISTSQNDFSTHLSDRTVMLSRLQNDKVKLESKKDTVDLTLDEIKNHMWEEHEKTLDDAAEFTMEIENETAVQKKISDLRIRMRSLGSVNFGAIEEYQRINDRYTFMTNQKNDVETAKKDLEEMIEALTKEMKEQFIFHFAQINENFKNVFSDLFSGGTAEILLENEEDILSCDIQIRAQPPGKKLQSLSLLSGGERCLTAIALLFSILQLRPAPFCVLDEVEAALDDVNVTRFTDFVRNYTEKSQFILVTHRKGTMEACDRMYGVTMQERGISKILSMRLGDAV